MLHAHSKQFTSNCGFYGGLTTGWYHETRALAHVHSKITSRKLNYFSFYSVQVNMHYSKCASIALNCTYSFIYFSVQANKIKKTFHETRISVYTTAFFSSSLFHTVFILLCSSTLRAFYLFRSYHSSAIFFPDLSNEKRTKSTQEKNDAKIM